MGLKLGLRLCLGLAVCAATITSNGPAQAARLRIHKPGTASSPTRAVSAADDSVSAHPGRRPFRDFLRPAGELPLGRPKLQRPRARPYPIARVPFAAATETIRVLGIRVDFLTDRGGPLTTTPDGKFDLRSREEAGVPTSLVDPPPHNRDYFMAHLESLANYYETQSYGQVVIEYDVYPKEQNEAFHLGDHMDYGPWAISQDSLIVRAARDLFIDSILAADSGSDVDFSEYDAYIVFHAGADFQSDINRDSPRDLPSYTIPLLEDSIAVNEGSHYVHLGMVMPETSSQDDFLGAINGVMAHEFGHILGLPDLYDIDTLFPVVGDFSLMDTGAMLQGVLEDEETGDLYAVYGLLPVSLDIWSKAILWPETINLQAVEREVETTLEATETSPTGLFVLINAEEYFLIENRQVDLDGDLTVVLNADSATGVVLGPENGEYDFLMPGLGGILVWHIDESAIFGRNVGAYGGVNTNRERRGIRLEEADGIYDIGNPYSIYFTGSAEEPFFVGNNTLFSTWTIPSSSSNSGGHSHITMEVFDPPSQNMRVRVEREWGREKWPVWLNAPMGEGSAWAGDLGGGRTSLAFVTTDSVLYVAQTPGNDWDYVRVGLPAMPIPGISGGPGGLVFVSVPGTGVLAFDRFGAAPALWDAGPTSVSTGPAVTATGLAVGLEDGRVAFLNFNDGSWTTFETGAGIGPVISPLLVEDLDGDGATEIGLATQEGAVRVLGVDGSVERSFQWRDGVVWLAAGDMDRAQDPPIMEFILADSSGTVELLDLDGSVTHSWGGRGVRLSGSRPAIADVDGDGFLEYAFICENGDLYLMNHNANAVENWPYHLDSGSAPDSIRWVSSPVMADVDEDGLPEVLVGSLTGDLVALENDGRVSHGWPYSFGLPVCSSPLVQDVSGEERMSVIVGGEDGVLHSLFTPTSLAGEEDAPWPRYGRDAAMSNVFPNALLGAPVLATELMPANSVYVYPSPVVGDRAYVRYALSQEAEVTVTVVDIRGQQVDVLRQTGAPQENEIEWATENLGSGLYFLRVVARSPEGAAQAKTVKVAIAR